jgi:hypothetical protein
VNPHPLLTEAEQRMLDRCSAYISVDRRPYSERKARYQVASDRLHRGGFCDPRHPDGPGRRRN